MKNESNAPHIDKAILNLEKAAKLIFLPGFDGELFCMELNAIIEAYGDSQNIAVATEIYNSKYKSDVDDRDEALLELETYNMISIQRPQQYRKDYIVIDNDGSNYLRIVGVTNEHKTDLDEHITLSYKTIKEFNFMVLSKDWDENLDW